VLLEGKDISTLLLTHYANRSQSWRQFSFFLKDTIRENVRLGRAPAANNAEIEEACKLAHIHDVIVDPQRMPKGYDTIVGVQVPSGGQKPSDRFGALPGTQNQKCCCWMSRLKNLMGRSASA